LTEIVDRLLKAIAMGGAIFGVVLTSSIAFGWSADYAVALPVGTASLWYLAETWRADRRRTRHELNQSR